LASPTAIPRPLGVSIPRPLTLGLLFAGAALLSGVTMLNGIQPNDEGLMLEAAARIAHGQVPYRDFFTQLTPGAFVALAAVFWVTGPSVIVGRWVTVAIGLGITFMLYRGGRQIASRPAAAVAALAFPVWGIAQGWFYPNYSWFALAAAVGALLCVLRGLTLRGAGRAARWAAAAGLLCGLAAFCKQNMGLYALVGLVAAWAVVGPAGWRGRVLGALAMVAASTPIPLALVLWLAANGALADFYRDAVWIPLAVFPKEMAAPYPPFWPPWPLPTDPKGQGAWAFRLVCLLPPLPYGLGAIYLIGSTAQHHRLGVVGDPPRAARRAAFVAWLAFGAAIWATTFPRADFDHVQVALGPAFAIAAGALEGVGRLLVRRGARWRRGPVGGTGASEPAGRVWRLWRLPNLPQTLACAVIGGFLLAGLGHARVLHMGPGWSLRTIDGVAPRAAGILLDHDDSAELNRLIREIGRLSAPGDAIAAVPWNAGLYFLTERRNPTRYDLIIPASVLPDDLSELERDLMRAQLVVYWTARDTFIDNTSLDDRLPELDRYIITRYRTVGAVNAYRLLVRD